MKLESINDAIAAVNAARVEYASINKVFAKLGLALWHLDKARRAAVEEMRRERFDAAQGK